jgi:fumarate reductase (CoM/CoB) subunit A
VTQVRTAECDVLVVGGGLAAMRAAVEAARTGARVIVACKRKIGRSGSSANTTGGYAAPVTEEDDWQFHLRDTLRGGAHMGDPDLASTLCAEALTRLQELEQAGAVFHKRDGRFVVSPSGDHSRARVVVPLHSRGLDLTLPLRAWAETAGCAFVEDLVVSDLLTDDGCVVGAVAFERLNGAPWRIDAGATVVATGGAGQLFQVTSNPVDVTGDGFAMGLRAGACLRDMEFIQFYPWRLIRPFARSRVPVQPSTFAIGARLYNAEGERFMESVDPQRKESTTRDVAARGIFDQIRRGLDVDGGVRLDISHLSDEEWRTTNPRVAALMERRGMNPRALPLVVAPEAHFVMGGLAVDQEGRASLGGLFAAGEAAGGPHGANRLNSNAIPDTQVFGQRAGRAAAAHAAVIRASGRRDRRGDPSPVDRLLGRLASLSDDAAGERANGASRHDEIQRVAALALGIIRNRDTLSEASDRLRDLRERSAAARPRNHRELETLIEQENLCIVAEASVHAASAREESRGAHYREDYPQTDSAWRRTILLRWSGDAIDMQVEPLPPEPEGLPEDVAVRPPVVGEHVE